MGLLQILNSELIIDGGPNELKSRILYRNPYNDHKRHEVRSLSKLLRSCYLLLDAIAFGRFLRFSAEIV